MTAIRDWKWDFKGGLKDNCQRRIKGRKWNLHNVLQWKIPALATSQPLRFLSIPNAAMPFTSCHKKKKNMKQPGTKGWWGEFRKWHAVNESEQQCGALCRWQTDRSLRTRPGYSQSRGLASNSGSAPLFLQLRSSRQMWLNQYGSTITHNGSHSVSYKTRSNFFQKSTLW